MLLPYVRAVIDWAIGVYILVLIIRMIVDWVLLLNRNWHPTGVVASLISIVYQLTEPPLRWLRRYIPPVRFGSVGFDVSFVVLYFILIVLQVLI